MQVESVDVRMRFSRTQTGKNKSIEKENLQLLGFHLVKVKLDVQGLLRLVP